VNKLFSISGKVIALGIIALLAGTGIGTFIVAPVFNSQQQQTQNLILFYTLGGVQVSGSLYIAGSTTVLPITEAMAAPFNAKYPLITVQAAGGGSGTGYSSVISGDSLIGAASRPPKGSEISQATSNGVKLVGWTIGADAICVIYNMPSIPELNLTRKDVKEIFERAGTANPVLWSQFGGSATPINVFIREAGSGTRGDFESSGADGFNITRTDWTGIEVKTSNGQMKNDVIANEGYMGYIAISYYLSPPQPQAANIAFYNWTSGTTYDYFAPSKDGVKEWAQSQIINPGVYTTGYFACRFLYYVTNGFPASGSLVDKYLSFVLSTEGQAVVDSVNYVSMKTIGYYAVPVQWN
jgi:phosphate transport system substrate-binding protein